MYTLGINAAYHDSAACLVKNGKVVAAAEEERFTRIKHGKRPIPFSTYELPFHAIHYCLKEAKLILSEVDHIAYSYNPFLLLEEVERDVTVMLPLEPSAHPVPAQWEFPRDQLFISSIVNVPRQLADGVPYHLKERFRGASINGSYKWHFIDHHTAHAASAFLASPFSHAAVLTLDGRGEKATTSYSIGADYKLDRLGEVTMPHSLGLLYEEVTTYLGFQHSSDEYKVMALASFGKPRYAEEVADLLIQDKVIGWFQGRMEFGPRALGARSIIASPMKACMQDQLNEIKDREDFRPVAPVVLEEEVSDWFINGGVSPFMLFVYGVQPDKIDRIPAVRHIDGSARIQTIRREHNPRYYDLIHEFKSRTGIPVLINTAFNTRGKPIVCTPRDAVECFWTSPIDALVIGSYLLEKPKRKT